MHPKTPCGLKPMWKNKETLSCTHSHGGMKDKKTEFHKLKWEKKKRKRIMGKKLKRIWFKFQMGEAQFRWT